MGILNVTPDSFSDGGQFFDTQRAIEHGLSMVEAGVSLIDIGGESTRPGADKVSQSEEISRVTPVIEALVAQTSVPISIDTSNPEVMVAAVTAGASMINDVRALQRHGALEAAADLKVPVCLMHMQGEPDTMQVDPRYNDVVTEVADFLKARVDCAVDAGIPLQDIVIDPGFGFGKNLEHNLRLLDELAALLQIGVPVLAGLSRKSMIVKILGYDPQDRRPSSLALALIATQNGASILRVHDVRETVEALSVLKAIRNL
ncbi:MAG: dihydropteroate synthase [marine bacterium B5-7]|nr:MAG: dihydropteroate synthase [marine bacterium B5-7]